MYSDLQINNSYVTGTSKDFIFKRSTNLVERSQTNESARILANLLFKRWFRVIISAKRTFLN